MVKNKILSLLKNKKVLIGLGVVVVGGGIIIATHETAKPNSVITVAKSSISESVSITGNTVPVQTVALSFGSSGIVSRIYSEVGKNVVAGQMLAQLNIGDLYGQIQQAKANVASAQAKLDGLMAGSRPEDVQSSQAAVDKANQDLQNLYLGIGDKLIDSFTKANDAVKNQLTPFFTNADTANPRLTYATAYSTDQYEAESQRQAVGNNLIAWNTEIGNGVVNAANATTLAQNGINYLSGVRNLLGHLSTTLNSAPGLDASTLASYKADVASALSEVNTATNNLNTALQNISSQKIVIKQLQAQLDLKNAGSSAQDIAAQQAQVQSAAANVLSIESKLSNSQIVSPISGIVTQFDAKVGQFASAGNSLISVISDKKFEVDAMVPETDIGKLAVGDNVEITFDAFADQTFKGGVFYIDKGETITSGVVNYKIKILFNELPDVVRSGLTANLAVETRHKDNALVLPQYAILQNDQGTFVQIMENKKVKNIPVVLGIQDNKGNVEIVSRVTEGEQVLNIGLK